MLTISNIDVAIGGSRILRNLSMEVPPNRLVCLMGRNGVGKSTTLKSIVGLLKPSTGSIKLNDRDLLPLKPEARAHAGLAYVPQGRDIFPNMTVEENLRIGLVASGKGKNGQMTKVLDLFPVLKEMLARKGGVLSGGQQQQLAIARAMLTDPKLLILDEPTEGIQPNIIDLIGDTLIKIKKETDISILLVEQYLDFAQALADIFYIMDRGSIVAHGPIAELTDAVVKEHLMV
jgi:urea transport system ATP-binding protein